MTITVTPARSRVEGGFEAHETPDFACSDFGTRFAMNTRVVDASRVRRRPLAGRRQPVPGPSGPLEAPVQRGNQWLRLHPIPPKASADLPARKKNISRA